MRYQSERSQAPSIRAWHLLKLRARNLSRSLGDWPRELRSYAFRWARENPYLTAAALYSLARATGVTVRSGQIGMRFTLGRANKVLEPGFHFLIPFAQRAKRLPSRSRTLELEDQTVVTLDGLVYRVQANVVWRITDIRKALIEISDVEVGLEHALALTVQTVLRGAQREDLRVSPELDGWLETDMAKFAAPWGVEIERAGFQTIAPSDETLALVQLRQRVAERRRALDLVRENGWSDLRATTLLSTSHFPRTRAVRARRREAQRRSRRRAQLRHLRGQSGWNLRWVPKLLGDAGVGSAPR